MGYKWLRDADCTNFMLDVRSLLIHLDYIDGVLLDAL